MPRPDGDTRSIEELLRQRMIRLVRHDLSDGWYAIHVLGLRRIYRFTSRRNRDHYWEQMVKSTCYTRLGLLSFNDTERWTVPGVPDEELIAEWVGTANHALTGQIPPPPLVVSFTESAPMREDTIEPLADWELELLRPIDGRL